MARTTSERLCEIICVFFFFFLPRPFVATIWSSSPFLTPVDVRDDDDDDNADDDDDVDSFFSRLAFFLAAVIRFFPEASPRRDPLRAARDNDLQAIFLEF